MSRGRRETRRPPKAPKAIIVRPEPDNERVRKLVTTFASAAERQGLRIVLYKTHQARVSEEPWEKPARFLRPQDADNVYRLIHHGSALVVAFTAAFVRRNPGCNPVTLREAIPLGTFVAHKAQFALLNGFNDVRPALEAFRSWSAQTRCSGRDDPRILPFQTFTTSRTWPGLGDGECRARFDEEHGRGGLRVDHDGRRWARASALHGWEALTVAGCELPTGTHWDVQSGRGSTELYCANEIWHVPRRGYVNVYPDGGVRGESGGPSAKQVWPPQR